MSLPFQIYACDKLKVTRSNSRFEQTGKAVTQLLTPRIGWNMEELMAGKLDDNYYGLIEKAMQAASSGNYSMAEQLLLQSYGSIETEAHHINEVRGKVFHLLANSYRDRGKLHVSREFYEKARKELQQEYKVVPLALFDDMYVQALYERDFAFALSAQKELHMILSSSGCHPTGLRLKNLLRLTAITWVLSNYEDAEAFLKEYLQLSEQSDKFSKRDMAQTLMSLGLLAFRNGNLQEAESLYKKAWALSEEFELFSEQEHSELLRQLGMALCGQQKHEEAQSVCARSVNTKENASLANNQSEQFREIADVYCAKGCFSEAARYCAAALDASELGSYARDKSESIAHILRRLNLCDDAIAVEKLAYSKCAA